jgi:hypothetical protein
VNAATPLSAFETMTDEARRGNEAQKMPDSFLIDSLAQGERGFARQPA